MRGDSFLVIVEEEEDIQGMSVRLYTVNIPGVLALRVQFGCKLFLPVFLALSLSKPVINTIFIISKALYSLRIVSH